VAVMSDGHMDLGGGELLLHLTRTTHPGQIHVEHETAGHFVLEPSRVARSRTSPPEVRRVDQPSTITEAETSSSTRTRSKIAHGHSLAN